MRAILYGLVALIGCASLPAQKVSTSQQVRARVAERDLAWLGDSIPLMRFNMPFSYTWLRSQMEECSGLKREGWPTFYLAPINPIWMAQGPAAAMYVHKTNVVVFALGSETVPWIIRHELGHFLLNGMSGHPEQVFGPESPCAPLLQPS
jgi:hypothetical protein